MYVCLSVCLHVYYFINEHILETAHPNFAEFSVHVSCGHISVLLWQRCSMYFRFCRRRHFAHSGSYGAIDTTECKLRKLAFHDADTDILADFRAMILARKSARRAAARAARSASHEPDTYDDPRRLVRGLLSDTRPFPREDVRWGCARVHVYVYCT